MAHIRDVYKFESNEEFPSGHVLITMNIHFTVHNISLIAKSKLSVIFATLGIVFEVLN